MACTIQKSRRRRLQPGRSAAWRAYETAMLAEFARLSAECGVRSFKPVKAESDGLTTTPYHAPRRIYDRTRGPMPRRAGSGSRSRRERVQDPNRVVRAGEILLRDFIKSERVRCSRSESVIRDRILGGLYPGIDIRFVTQKFQFVTVRELPIAQPLAPLPGEILFKDFVASEAARLGEKFHTVYQRIKRGGYPHLRFRRVTRSIVFVVPGTAVMGRSA